jgi:hypothetical protein
LGVALFRVRRQRDHVGIGDGPPVFLGRMPGGPCGLVRGGTVVTVGPDVGVVERQLRSGALRCPDCHGVLRPWGRARPRTLRADPCSVGPVERLVPRRSMCVSCGRTHVLSPLTVLSRRADGVEVIGAALLARARGWGYRRVAARVGRPTSTVRGWLARMAANAERICAVFTRLVHELEADPAPVAPAGSAFADAVAAVGAGSAAVRRRFGVAVVVVSAWQVAAALTHGRLLTPTSPTKLINTSWHLAGLS